MSKKSISPELRTQFTLDFGQLLEKKVIELKLSPLDAWVAVSHIQLALRHPKNLGPSSTIARSVAERLIAAVATTPALREIANLGFDADYDVPEEEQIG